MSTTINLHPSTQHAVRYTLAHQRFPFSQMTTSSSISAAIFPESYFKSLCSLVSTPQQFATQPKINIHPNLCLYISDLFSAVRHHPQLDAMLLTATARKDIEVLVRAARVVGGDLTGAEFICTMGKGAEVRSEAEMNGSRDGAGGDVGGLDTTASWFVPGISTTDVASVVLDETLDVSEADIARIVPLVLSHRLQVRDGPKDEILESLQHISVENCVDWELGAGEKQRRCERSIIKDILIKILAEV